MRKRFAIVLAANGQWPDAGQTGSIAHPFNWFKIDNKGAAPVGTPAVTAQANQVGTGAASAIVLTVPAVAGQTNQVSGFTVSGLGATGASNINITLAGAQGGTLNFELAIPAGVAVIVPILTVTFSQPLVASGPNVAMVLTVPSFGAGNTLSQATLQAQTVTPAVAAASPGGAVDVAFSPLQVQGDKVAAYATISPGKSRVFNVGGARGNTPNDPDPAEDWPDQIHLKADATGTTVLLEIADHPIVDLSNVT